MVSYVKYVKDTKSITKHITECQMLSKVIIQNINICIHVNVSTLCDYIFKCILKVFPYIR